MFLLSACIHFIVASALMALTNWAGLISWRRAANAHWTKRALRLWPVRFTAALNVWLIPAILSLAHLIWFPATASWWILNTIASFLGALLGCFLLEHEIFPQLDFKKWRHQLVAGWGIRFGFLAVPIAGFLLMPEVVGWKMLFVTSACFLIHLAMNRGLLLRYLRWVKYARPAGERLHRIIDDAAAKMRVTPRAIWQLAGPHANAFAFPITGELVFSDRLLEVCTDEEIFGIGCHELAHLSESKTVLAGRLLGAFTIFPLIFISPCVHYFSWGGMLIPYMALFVLSRFSRALSIKMERRADQLALDKQLSEGVYARALEKLYHENQIPAVNVNDKQTHPHLYDRMLAAGITPDYPRPAKPRRLTLMGWWLWFIFGLLAVWVDLVEKF